MRAFLEHSRPERSPTPPRALSFSLQIGSAGVRRLLPHGGAMCLVDAVETWNEQAIICRSASHRDPRHPLRRKGGLAALHAFEYGGQAAAVHGALLAQRAGGRAPIGHLAAIKAGKLFVSRLDDLPGDLRIRAERRLGDPLSVVYDCRIELPGLLLAEGRLTIVFPDSP